MKFLIVGDALYAVMPFMKAVKDNGWNYLFRVKDLEKIMNESFPLHIVEKKIPHIDANGEHVEPKSPNGYKYETLVLDMIHLMDSCLPFEVVREHEFAPIKNKTGVDSVESAKELCKKNL